VPGAEVFAGGVWFVDLAPVSDPGLLAGAVTRTLELPERASAPLIEALTEWLLSALWISSCWEADAVSRNALGAAYRGTDDPNLGDLLPI